MQRSKFRYNPETLNYEKIKYSFEQKLIRFLLRTGGSLLAAAIIIFGLSFFIDLPKDRILESENQHLKEQLNNFDNKLTLIEDVLSNLQERDDDLYRTIFLLQEALPSQLPRHIEILTDHFFRYVMQRVKANLWSHNLLILREHAYIFVPFINFHVCNSK